MSDAQTLGALIARNHNPRRWRLIGQIPPITDRGQIEMQGMSAESIAEQIIEQNNRIEADRQDMADDLQSIAQHRQRLEIHRCYSAVSWARSQYRRAGSAESRPAGGKT